MSDIRNAPNYSDKSWFNLNPCVSTSHWLLSLYISTTANRAAPCTASQPPCDDRQAPINLLLQHTQARSVHPAARPSIFTRTLAVSIHQTAGEGVWAIGPQLILVIYLGNMLKMAREDKRWHCHASRYASHCHLFHFPLSLHWCTIF